MKKIGILLLFICLVLTGCGESKESKTVGTLSNFETNAINNGFTVTDNMSNYQNFSYIIDSMIANKDSETIEMVIYDTVDNATKAQDSQINTFKNFKGTGAKANKDKGANYYKYTFISNNQYMVTSRIENTLIFSKVPLANKQDIENILNSMNY